MDLFANAISMVRGVKIKNQIVHKKTMREASAGIQKINNCKGKNRKKRKGEMVMRLLSKEEN
jgi:hypothetical protein